MRFLHIEELVYALVHYEISPVAKIGYKLFHSVDKLQ